MKAAAGRLGEFVSFLDAADLAACQHKGFARFFVGDGVDAADLRALLVGGDEVFLILGFHVYRSVSGAGIFSRDCADKGIIQQWRWGWGLRCVE